MATKPPGYVFGRPTKYNPTFVLKAEHYLQACLNPKDGKMKIPFIEEFALTVLNVDDDTVVEWAKKYPDFSVAIKKIMSLQQLRLTQRCLGKNPAGSIFLLKVNHDKKDRVVVEGMGNGNQDNKLDEIATLISSLKQDVKSNPSQQS